MSEPNYKAFAIEIMRDWPEVGNLDGYDLQNLAVAHGLLRIESRTVPCSEDCNCAEFTLDGDISECYVLDSEIVSAPTKEPGA